MQVLFYYILVQFHSQLKWFLAYSQLKGLLPIRNTKKNNLCECILKQVCRYNWMNSKDNAKKKYFSGAMPSFFQPNTLISCMCATNISSHTNNTCSAATPRLLQ